jgi:hypothetical protein
MRERRIKRMDNEKDKQLMDMIMADKDRYAVVVDNDSVWVEDKTKDEETEDVYVGSFSEFGYHLLVQIFRYLGLDADYC